MIRVVVTGSECTGKTTLSLALAAHYAVDHVPEYARRFVEENDAAPEYADVDKIARGQIDLEDEHADGRANLLIQDTDLLSTVVYSHHYYGDCPTWVEVALRARTADLYLLGAIDVPWISDGAQRDRGDRREEMHELFRRALGEQGLRFVEIGGDREIRVAAAVRAIDPLLAP